MNLERYMLDCADARGGRRWLCRMLRPTLGRKLAAAFLLVLAAVAALHVMNERHFAAGRGIAAQVDAVGSLRWTSQRLLLHAYEGRAEAAEALLARMAETLTVLGEGGVLREAWVPPLADRDRHEVLEAARLRLARALGEYLGGRGARSELLAAADALHELADALNAELALRRQAIERAARTQLWLISLLVATLLLAVYVAVRLRVVQPLEALAAASRAFAAGRHAVRSRFRSLDEVGQLARAFDDMADTIERDLAQLAADALELEARRQALAKFSLAVEQAPVSVIITDAEARIEYVNPKFVALSGYTAEEVLGRTPGLFKSGHTPPEVYAAMWRALRAGREWHGELLNRKKDGTLFWEDTSIAPLKDAEGRITHFVAVKEDVTARKQAEAERAAHRAELERQVAERTRRLTESNRELEAFSYSIAHDLRAPLRAINGFASLMAEGCHGCGRREALECLGRIRRASVRMGSLIDDILELSRLARREPVLGHVDLSAMARTLLEELAAAEPGRRVRFDVQEGVSARADAGLLYGALQNLLGNAWKFTAGREEAVIAFGARAEDGETVYFVRDNGAGFDMRYADKLFVPFQRLHGAQEFEGNGIGLAMVQRIIGAHGGRVWAQSAPGAGATFYFTLGASGGHG